MEERPSNGNWMISKGCVLVKAIGLKMLEDLHTLYGLSWKDEPSYAKSFRIFETILRIRDMIHQSTGIRR